ncbi:MAG: hypothetical protein H6733_00525 [Alphaproteobacteria bacterium]|nr:hypothetical protein [Alphaproteobacteria bacterium]
MRPVRSRRFRLVAAVVAFLALAVGTVAAAHPMSRDKWSLRTAVQIADGKLDAIVVLEVPFDVVTKDLKADMDAARAAPDASKAAQQVLDAYTKAHWDRLGKGLTLQIDGKKVAGSWKPRDNRLNGKGAVTGGFFMYIVEFVPDAPLTLGTPVTITIDDAGYADVDMVYSAMVVAGDGWTVEDNSAAKLLPATPYDINNPAFWVADPALRHLAARFARTP